MLTADPFELVVSRLNRPRQSGDGVTAHCSGHDDRHESLSVQRGTERAVVLRCFAGCQPADILRALGFSDEEIRAILAARTDGKVTAQTSSRAPARTQQAGITVSETARSKGLPEKFLREEFGLRDAVGRRAVEIPYPAADGTTLFTRTRVSTSGKSKTLQPAGVQLVPYGLNRLDRWRAASKSLAVEGESDTWTGWRHDVPTLGLPGASSAGSLELEHVEGMERLYVLQEPDAGGPAFYTGIRQRLTALGWTGDVYAFALTLDGRSIKDLSDLHLAVGGDRAAFLAALDASMQSAVLVDLDADQLIAWDEDVQSVPVSVGTDGAQMCQSCTDLEHENGKLREIIREQKAELRLIRAGNVSPGEAMVLAQLATVRASAQSRGETAETLYVPELARVAGVGENTVTRAFNQLRRWQADPEIAATLPYQLEDYREGMKSRARLVVSPMGDGDTKSAALSVLAQLPREEGRARPGGKRCPHHPEAAIVRTTHWRCTEDDCTWTEQESARLNDTVAQDGPVQIHGETYVTEVVAAPVAQDGPPNNVEDLPAQDGPLRKLIPVSFVARDQIEAAAGKPWPDPGVPDAEPIPRPRCVRTGCQRPSANGFVCLPHLQEPADDVPLLAVAGGEE